MAKKLFRNIVILLLANLLIKPIWIFGIDLKVQNMVGAEDYGFYFVVFSFSFLFHIFLDLGVHQFNNRELAQNPTLLQERFGKLFLLKGILALAYFALTFTLAYSLGYTAAQKEMLLFLAINQMLLSFILFSRSNYTAMQWYKTDAFFSVFDRILSISFCLVLLYTSIFGSFQIAYFIYAQTLALAISAVLSLAVVFVKGRIIYPSFDFKTLFPLLKQALPYAIVVLLMTIYTRIDAVMLEKILPENGNNQAGIYAAGYRILDAVNMVPFLLASLLIPFFARQLKLKESFKEELWTSIGLLFAICIPFVLVVFFYTSNIVPFLYDASDNTWFMSFKVLLYSFPFIFLSYVFGGFLTAAARLKTISILALITILINIALNYFLIPKYGAGGAAIATIISQALMAFSQTIIVFSHWKIQLDKKMLARAIVYFTLLIAFGHLLSLFSFSFLVKILLITLIAIILSLVLRLISIEKIRAL